MPLSPRSLFALALALASCAPAVRSHDSLSRLSHCPLAPGDTARLELGYSPRDETLIPRIGDAQVPYGVLDVPMRVVDVSFLRVPVRCSQGPFEIRLTAQGSHWAERFDLVAVTPRRLGGVATLTLDGVPFYTNNQPYRWGAFDGVDNARCVASTTDRAPAGFARDTSTTGAMTGATSTEQGVAAATLPASSFVALVPTEPTSSQWLASCERVDMIETTNTDINRWAMHPGAQLSLRLWSPAPNDFEGAFIAIVHRVANTGMTDEAYAQHIRDVKREHFDWQVQQIVLARAGGLHCQQHPEDTTCWGGMTREAFIASAQARHREALERERNAPAPAPPVEMPMPTTAPPAPRAESQPPRPSVHAEWVPGYWQWGDRAWGWVGGRWRVPESDVQADLTVHAPAPPPAPRNETPPAPSPLRAAVWTPGYWQWDGRAFIWVEGRYQLPPAPTHQWRPDAWRPTPSGAVFLPGGWVIPLP